MSWESEIENIIKWRTWPNPFRNMIKRIDVLACNQETWLAMVEFWGLGAANFFWSNFIPSPVEITRKIVLGSYRCGFYSKIRIKSPIDIIWRDGRTSRMLLQIANPFTRGLFYYWAANTIWEGLQTWQSMIYKQEACNWGPATVVFANALDPWNTENGGGAFAFPEVVWDPWNRAANNIVSMSTGSPCEWQAFAVGYVVNSAHEIHDFRIRIEAGAQSSDWFEMGGLGPFETGYFYVRGAGFNYDGAIAPHWEGHLTLHGVQPAFVHMTRFVVNAYPDWWAERHFVDDDDFYDWASPEKGPMWPEYAATP